ncbi:hypothetical protein [Salmonella enterica]|uniref:Uncharacterized protein n=2 Tax=Salmonella enterica I TaxID=59201 RepID=A0A659MJ00_SALET|nr:hypothetical protein [Salmonella enterica]TGC36863.1 hypothetical protein C9F01_04580 [Salmonella enterica subsp. enterica serovar Wernigerode]TGC38545.1 hypothetical protein C9E93_15895 [Salmonella enterica subsp. enterica serovar Wernigerode]TGC97696.1 hypothetical protein C9F05_14365 [Salmonella enterica subsp. enterica serovar Wernigerode]
MTFTKEQLIEKAKENVDFFRDRLDLLPQSQLMALYLRLAEVALATLTTEPAMYCMKKGEALDIDASSTCKSVVDAWVDEWNEMQCEHGDDFSAVPLYRLPMVEDLNNDQ